MEFDTRARSSSVIMQNARGVGHPSDRPVARCGLCGNRVREFLTHRTLTSRHNERQPEVRPDKFRRTKRLHRINRQVHH
jgi:hypothetical protein